MTVLGKRADSSGVSAHCLGSQDYICVAAVSPAPTSLFNDISYLRVVPVRNLLFIGAFSLFNQFLPLSFFVPCTLEVTSGMLPGFCIPPGKVPIHFDWLLPPSCLSPPCPETVSEQAGRATGDQAP